MKQVVSRRSWDIQFADRQRQVQGRRAEASSSSCSSDLIVASGTIVEIHGHTDDSGSVGHEHALSEERAFAVKKWLEEQSPANFPRGAHQGVRPRPDRAGRSERHVGGAGQEPARRDRAGHRRADLTDVHSSIRARALAATRARERGAVSAEPGRLARIFLPNRAVDRATAIGLVALWAVVAFVVWLASPWQSLPAPREVWRAFGSLWWDGGMGPELFTTLKLITHALFLTGA